MTMTIDTAVVPVAGLGTRLPPATKSQPKEMLAVGRKPVVQYVVEKLARVGMTRVLFITGPGKSSIENHFDAYFRAFVEFALADPRVGAPGRRDRQVRRLWRRNGRHIPGRADLRAAGG